MLFNPGLCMASSRDNALLLHVSRVSVYLKIIILEWAIHVKHFAEAFRSLVLCLTRDVWVKQVVQQQ